jgi:hypothetical protein
MTGRELYVQLATSCIEELAARWLPFTLLPMKDILQTQNWFWVTVFGIAFGMGHLITYRECHKILFMAAAGVILNWLYVFAVPQGWNLLAVIALHFIARLVGLWWRRRKK